MKKSFSVTQFVRNNKPVGKLGWLGNLQDDSVDDASDISNDESSNKKTDDPPELGMNVLLTVPAVLKERKNTHSE